MIVDFNAIPVNDTPNFKGGEGIVQVQMFVDSATKIGQLHIKPGSSVGLHTHEGNYEIVYFVSGSGVCLDDGVAVPVQAGMTHYCMEGHNHSIMNPADAKEDLVLFAVIPNSAK